MCGKRWNMQHQTLSMSNVYIILQADTVYPKKYAHGFVVLCFVVVMQSFIMNSHEVFIHIHQGCFAGTGAIVRLPQCQWSKPDGYWKISQCITTTKHSKAKTVCIFLGIYCMGSCPHHEYCSASVGQNGIMSLSPIYPVLPNFYTKSSVLTSWYPTIPQIRPSDLLAEVLGISHLISHSIYPFCWVSL